MKSTLPFPPSLFPSSLCSLRRFIPRPLSVAFVTVIECTVNNPRHVQTLFLFLLLTFRILQRFICNVRKGCENRKAESSPTSPSRQRRTKQAQDCVLQLLEHEAPSASISASIVGHRKKRYFQYWRTGDILPNSIIYFHRHSHASKY